MNFYKHFLGDYSRDTAHLAMLEHGAYRLMLDHYYATGKGLPADKALLYRICKASSKAERAAVDLVAEAFFPINGDGTRHNKRADREIAETNAYSEAQRDRASKKWGTENSDSTDRKKRSARLATARGIATHSTSQWISLVDLCGAKCLQCGSAEHLVKDHIVPIYQGGSDGIENLQPLCHRCNSSKGPDSSDLRPSDWRQRMPAEMPAMAEPNASRTPASHSHSQIKTKSKTLSGKPDDAIEVLKFLNLKANRSYRPVKAHCEMIQARLAEGFTVAELKQVTAKKCREWLADDKMAEYLRPKTLFSRTNFANYAGELVDAAEPS